MIVISDKLRLSYGIEFLTIWACLVQPNFAEESPAAPTFKRIQLSDQFYCEGATCADINGDGLQDFIAGPYWFAGPEFAEPHEYRPAQAFDINGYADNFFTFAHDFNDDGRVDILIVPMPGENAFWFENPADSDQDRTNAHWPRHLAFPAVDNESPALVDLTGDEMPELLCLSEGRFGYVEIPADPTEGAWPFHPISPNLGYGKFTHGLGLGDLNHDGRRDLLEKNGWWEQPASLAGDPLWTFHPVAFSEAGGAQMLVFDVDGDGDSDVVTSKVAHGYGLSWFENYVESGQRGFREHVIMSESPTDDPAAPAFSQLHAVAVADVNGDNIPDIITGKRFWAHNGNDPGANEPAVLYWYETVRHEGRVEFRPHLIDRNSGVGTQVEAADINADGLVDVLVGNKKGLFIFLQNK